MTGEQTPSLRVARKAYMEGIHAGFDRRICTDASSKSLPIATYCLRTFHRLGTNPTGKTALHLPWSDFRASFGAEDAGIQEYSNDDKPEITGNRPCQAARIPFMYAHVFSPVSPHFRGTTGRQQNSLRLFCFLPVNLSFIVAFAPLKVSLWRRMSADATGNFILTGDNALPLTAFALAFSPVSPLSENDGKTN